MESGRKKTEIKERGEVREGKEGKGKNPKDIAP